MSLQMRLLAALPGRSGRASWTSAAKVRDLMGRPHPSTPVPHELYQVNHVVTDTVPTADGEFTTYSLVPATDAPRDTPLDICIYVHGGGYVHGLSTAHWTFISDIAGAGMKVIVPDYGLAPEYEATSAARLLDAVLDRAVAEADAAGLGIRLAADSAGAGLALGWMLDRADRTDRTSRIDRIDRAVLSSPWLDATCSSPGTEELVAEDPWLHPDGLRIAGEAWGRQAGVGSVLVSPLKASDAALASLPPLHIWSGTRDVLHADATLLSRRTGCGMTVVDGALHNFPLLRTPEGKTARREIISRLAT
ncbi:alpha/beta hydrolase fold domain-containing protein [Corynebacterium glyciniphilum]|uniref:alpha/beta hydrolase fold domain-containing protein n=1 Tax=Corynebacterium glyciniphilum TaxID=1404244 RepID=UPI00264CADF1|nr:alpha/beta hydrolase [Corynebacterium glyciniphilum]MDN5683873.1 alpha/beta hydrolase [Corynebacterium glyciniphilum]MDN6706764.1 alpha/beta hydrolase [Corynebacterium glyciniphilum]